MQQQIISQIAGPQIDPEEMFRQAELYLEPAMEKFILALAAIAAVKYLLK